MCAVAMLRHSKNFEKSSRNSALQAQAFTLELNAFCCISMTVEHSNIPISRVYALEKWQNRHKDPQNKGVVSTCQKSQRMNGCVFFHRTNEDEFTLIQAYHTGPLLKRRFKDQGQCQTSSWASILEIPIPIRGLPLPSCC